MSERAVNDDALLEVENLTVDFLTRAGVVSPVRDVSLTVRRGETVALLGESGSGKSVTAQAIMRLLPKDVSRIASGAIRYNGSDLATMPIAQVRELCGPEIAMVFQDPLSSLNPVMKVGYQISEALWRRGVMNRQKARVRALELMDLVGIPDPTRRINDFPHQFSGGMRQRVMIAMALALEPQLLIADEPTTALDVTVQAQIIDLLAQLQKETGMAILLISHDLGVVADVADRVYVMYGGRIAERGITRDVYDHPAHPYTDGLLRSIPSEYGKAERLVPIPGSPPIPGAGGSGCDFAARCRFATDFCQSTVPELRNPQGWAPLQLAACHRTEEVYGDAG